METKWSSSKLRLPNIPRKLLCSLSQQNKSFISRKLVLLQIVQPFFVLAKSPSIVLSTPIYYNLNLSFCDLWSTLILEIPTIFLLVLYMGKYKRFHKRWNLCGPYPAGNTRIPCVGLLNNSFVCYWFEYLQSHFTH